MVIAFFLFLFIIRRFHLETHIFLFPGATRTAHNYGRREAVGRLIVAMVLLVVLQIVFVIVFRLLWR